MFDVTPTPCPVRSPTLRSVSPSVSSSASYQWPPISVFVDAGEVVGREVEGPGAPVREPQGAAPRRQHGLLQLDRDPVFGLRGLPLVVERVTGLADHPLAAAQFADVPQHGPHRGGAAVSVEHRFAHHVHGPDVAVPACDAELAVDGPGVDEAVRDHRRQLRPVLVEDQGRHLVEGERRSGGVAAQDLVELPGPTGLVRQQVPLGAADPAEQRARRGRGRFQGGRRGRRAVPQLSQMLVEVVELVQGQVVQGALPATPRVVRSVPLGVAPHRVHVALEPPRLRYERVDRAASGRLGGWAVRGEVGRHDALRCGDDTTKADGGTVTTVAQPATPCKGFGNTPYGGASGICHSLTELLRGRREARRSNAQVVGYTGHLTTRG